MLMIALAIVIYALLLHLTFKKKLDSPSQENKQSGNAKSNQEDGDINRN